MKKRIMRFFGICLLCLSWGASYPVFAETHMWHAVEGYTLANSAAKYDLRSGIVTGSFRYSAHLGVPQHGTYVVTVRSTNGSAVITRDYGPWPLSAVYEHRDYTGFHVHPTHPASTWTVTVTTLVTLDEPPGGFTHPYSINFDSTGPHGMSLNSTAVKYVRYINSMGGNRHLNWYGGTSAAASIDGNNWFRGNSNNQIGISNANNQTTMNAPAINTMWHARPLRIYAPLITNRPDLNKHVGNPVDWIEGITATWGATVANTIPTMGDEM